MSQRRNEAGAAAVEFALVSILLLTLLFGILQYSLYFWSLQAGEHAAREAARHAAVGALDCTELKTSVVSNAPGQTTSTVTATRTFYTDANMNTTTSAPKVGGVVQVAVRFNSINLHLPFIPFFNNGVVSEKGVSRIENVTSKSVACS